MRLIPGLSLALGSVVVSPLGAKRRLPPGTTLPRSPFAARAVAGARRMRQVPLRLVSGLLPGLVARLAEPEVRALRPRSSACCSSRA